MSELLQTLSVNDPADQVIERLATALNQIDVDINDRVKGHYEELLGQAGSLREAAAMIREISDGIQALRTAITRVKTELLGPYTRIKERTMQLQTMHDGAEQLREALKFETLIRRLKSEEQSNDIAKASSTHREIRETTTTTQAMSTARMQAAKEYLSKSGDRLVSTAEKTLMSGLEQLNQSDISTALQALKHLGRLDESVSMAVSSITDKASTSLAFALLEFASVVASDSQPAGGRSLTPTASSAAATTTTGATTTTWWARIAKTTEIISTACGQAWALSTALEKARDSVSGEPLAKFSVKWGYATAGSTSSTSMTTTPVKAVWKQLAKVTADKLSVSTRAGNTSEAAFVAEYPRLLKTWLEFIARLGPSLSGIPEAEEQMLQALVPFERLYLAASLQRLIEHANNCIGNNSASAGMNGMEALQALSRAINGELEAARASSPRLVEAVCRHAVGKVLRHLAARAEPLLSLDPPDLAFQVRERMNVQQLTNANIFQTLVTASAAVSPLVAPGTWLPVPAVELISSAISVIDSLADSCVAKLFNNAVQVLEASLYLIHSEDFSGDLDTSSSSSSSSLAPSAYVMAVDKQLRHFQTQFIARLAPCQLLTTHTTALCSRVILFFVRHASLIRPLGLRGKLHLANDMAQLEQSLARLQPARVTGDTIFKFLKAFRPLLHRELAEIASCPEITQLPPSVVWHHLFSRAGPNSELQSPHVFSRMSMAQYSEWLDKHSDEDIWDRVNATVQAYLDKDKKTPEGSDDSQVCQLLLSLGPRLLANSGKSL